MYRLSITNLVEPGVDTDRSSRIVWGGEARPGDFQLFTAQALAAAGGIVQHTYADGAAIHVIQVSAANEEGLFALGTHAVTVNNVAPAIAVSGATGIAEGGSYTLTLGPRVDPGADTPSLYSIDWGDGTARSELSPAAYDALVAGGGQLAHIYADGASNPVITVRVTDEDGEQVAAVKSIAVTNVAPTAVVSGAASAGEGSVYTLTVGPIADPGADTRSSYDTGLTDSSLLAASATSKASTPTMGGLLIVGAIVVVTLLLAGVRNFYIQLGLIVAVWLDVLGGFEDWLKLTDFDPCNVLRLSPYRPAERDHSSGTI